MHASISSHPLLEMHSSNSLVAHEQAGPHGFLEANILSRTAMNHDPLAPPQAPSGINKKDRLLKHQTRVSAVVAAMFRPIRSPATPHNGSRFDEMKRVLSIY